MAVIQPITISSSLLSPNGIGGRCITNLDRRPIQQTIPAYNVSSPKTKSLISNGTGSHKSTPSRITPYCTPDPPQTLASPFVIWLLLEIIASLTNLPKARCIIVDGQIAIGPTSRGSCQITDVDTSQVSTIPLPPVNDDDFGVLHDDEIDEGLRPN